MVNKMTHHPQLHKVAQRADSYLALNRLAVRASARTVAHRVQHHPRLAAWSLPYESIVQMMTLGTPHGEIRSACHLTASPRSLTRLG